MNDGGLDYKTLRSQVRAQQGRPSRFSAEIAEKRKKEQNWRTAEARNRALQALAAAFPDEFRGLYEAAKSEVAAERGSLPGDSE